MMKHKHLVAGIIGAAALLAFPAVSMAQWYGGAHVGQSDFDEAGEKDTAFRFFGGYQFNKNFAAEAAYTDFGKVTVAGTSLKGNAIELVGVGSMPVADRVSIYGKLGMFSGEAKASGAVNLKDDSIEVTYGFGVRYDVTPTIGVRGEWQNYSDVGDGATDISVLSVGVVFKF